MKSLIIARKASKFIRNKIDKMYVFHNIEHTKYVLRRALYLGNKSNCSNHELDLIRLAAWAHNLGYYEGSKDHEIRSAKMIGDWMKIMQYKERDIAIVRDAILATQIPQNANSIVGFCLCDADLAHLSSRNYSKWADRLINEWINLETYSNDPELLMNIQIKFFEKHTYLTKFAQDNWAIQKNKNLTELYSNIEIFQKTS